LRIYTNITLYLRNTPDGVMVRYYKTAIGTGLSNGIIFDDLE